MNELGVTRPSRCGITLIPVTLVNLAVAFEMHSDSPEKERMQPTQSTHATTDFTELATRARAEFREMPGMCLTTAQAARLWQLSPDQAQTLLLELVHAGFLERRDGQRYRLPSSV